MNRQKAIEKQLAYLSWHMHQNITLKEEITWFKRKFYSEIGYMLDLKEPKTFNEKINWYRFFYNNPIIPSIVDKITFKDYIREQIGDGYTAKLYGDWDDESQIDFNKLPNKFVLKSNHANRGRQIILVKDKNTVDFEELRYEVSDWLLPWNSNQNGFSSWNKHIKPRILAEEFLETDENDELTDYKFFCFNGEPQFMLVVSGRYKEIYKSYLDMNWNVLPFEVNDRKHPYLIEKPKNFDKMVELARNLSKPFPHVRIDFFEIENRVLLGEFTFSSGAGLNKFKPAEWDLKLGEYFQLPIK